MMMLQIVTNTDGMRKLYLQLHYPTKSELYLLVFIIAFPKERVSSPGGARRFVFVGPPGRTCALVYCLFYCIVQFISCAMCTKLYNYRQELDYTITRKVNHRGYSLILFLFCCLKWSFSFLFEVALVLFSTSCGWGSGLLHTSLGRLSYQREQRLNIVSIFLVKNEIEVKASPLVLKPLFYIESNLNW